MRYFLSDLDEILSRFEVYAFRPAHMAKLSKSFVDSGKVNDRVAVVE
jgi:hypothetical protein